MTCGSFLPVCELLHPYRSPACGHPTSSAHAIPPECELGRMPSFTCSRARASPPAVQSSSPTPSPPSSAFARCSVPPQGPEPRSFAATGARTAVIRRHRGPNRGHSPPQGPEPRSFAAAPRSCTADRLPFNSGHSPRGPAESAPFESLRGQRCSESVTCSHCKAACSSVRA